MKKSTKAIACVLAMMCYVPSIMAAQNETAVTLDSAQVEYLLGIDDPRTVDSLLVNQLGPMRRVRTDIEFQDPQDSTKTDTVSITEEIQSLHGWSFVIGASASGIADGMTYYNKSIGDHFTFRPELVFGLEGRQLGFGTSPLSHRSNFGLYGRLYMTQYSPKSTSAGKKYISGAFEAYWGYDIFGMKEGIHVLSIGPTFGFEMQKMDSVLSHEAQSFVVDQAWNFNAGIRIQYNVIIPKSGTHFSVIGGVRVSQVKAVNQTDWAVQIYGTIQVGQLMKPRIAKKELNERNKDIMEHLKPKDKK